MKNYMPVLIIGILILLVSSCVQQTYKRTIQFRVDASNLEEVETMSIRGQMSPLNWKTNYLLEDVDNDSIYTTEITFDTPFDYVDIKFVKNMDEFELEREDNRRIMFNGMDSIKYYAVFDKNE